MHAMKLSGGKHKLVTSGGNMAFDDIKGEVDTVTINLKGLPARQVLLHHYRIDDEHSNSYEVWKKMGSPQQPTPTQVATLEKAGQLQMLEKPKKIKTKQGVARIKMMLPRQAVSLVQLKW